MASKICVNSSKRELMVHRSSAAQSRHEKPGGNSSSATPVKCVLLEGAVDLQVSRYSVIFFARAKRKRRLLAQVLRTSDHDSSVSRVNGFAGQAESRKGKEALNDKIFTTEILVPPDWYHYEKHSAKG